MKIYSTLCIAACSIAAILVSCKSSKVAQHSYTTNAEVRGLEALTNQMSPIWNTGVTAHFKGKVSSSAKRAINQELVLLKRLRNIEVSSYFDGYVVKLMLPAGTLFSSNSSSLNETCQEELSQIASLIDKYQSSCYMRIAVHTDNVGHATVNNILSQKRAEALSNFFVTKGLDGQHIESRGFGGSYPVADNSSLAGALKNRRVEIFLIYAPR